MVDDFDLSGYTLFERQSKFYNATHCGYCFGLTDLVDSIEVYRESHGLIYICRKCRAWCGTHTNAYKDNDQSLGCVAKRPLRDARHECHNFLEPLIVTKIAKDEVSKRKAKAAAYNWLAKELGIDPIECHFGYFNLATCNRAMEIIKSVYPTPEQIEKRQREVKWNCDVFLFNAGTYNLEIKEFKVMNTHTLEIKHTPSGKQLFYNPKTNQAQWQGNNLKKRKWIDVGDQEEFLEKHFK